jgi:transposase
MPLSLAASAGWLAVHDAWAPYDLYLDVEHQLCGAPALAELASVAKTAPPNAPWSGADQAGDALVAMHHLVAQATAGAHTVDAHALATQVHRYRSATQLGITQTTRVPTQ